MLILSLFSYSQKASVEMQEIMVNSWSNAATDAALHYARQSSDVSLYGKVTLNPNEVWQEYKACFLRAANIYSEKNMELLEGYCPATIIAVNDGYFMRMRVNGNSKYTWNGANWQVSPGVIEYAWSQKIPYARSLEVTGGEFMYYADTMNGAWIYGYNTIYDLFVYNDASRPYDPANPDSARILKGPFVLGNEGIPMPDQAGGFHDLKAIATELIKAMDYMITAENNSISDSTWSKQHFYLPNEFVNQVEYQAVSFKGFTLLNIVQGFDMLGNKPVDFYTIAATQLVEATQYACFGSYYRPIYLNHPKYGNTMTGGYAGLTNLTGRIAHIVSSPEQAARLGYNPEPAFYERIN